MDEAASILSYTSILARSSKEWSALKDSILEVARAAMTIREVHEKTGTPEPPGLHRVLGDLLESIVVRDISRAASIVQEHGPLIKRASAAYLALYRLLVLTVSIPSLAGVLVSLYLTFTLASPIPSLAALTAAGLLASALIAPPRYSPYPLLASSLLLASTYPAGAPASILLYSTLLVLTAVLVGALRGATGTGPLVAGGG